MILQVYAPYQSPRLRYCLAFWAEEMLNLPYQLYTEKAEYHSAQGLKLNYSENRLSSNECWIAPHGLLLETGWKNQAIEIFQHRSLPAFFATSTPGTDLPFDLLAMSFYLLSRYEEYLDFEPDPHGRFPAKASLAYQEGFLQTPLLDAWAIELHQILQGQTDHFSFAPRTYRFLPTYDIDLAWAYRYKGWWRFWGGLWRDLLHGRWKAVGERLGVGLGMQNDPFDTFAYMEQWHEKLHCDPIYFFLVGDPGPHDKNHSPHILPFRRLIQSLHQGYRIGLHPSYRSFGDTDRVAQEQHRLESIIEEPIVLSRQHYLRLKFPATYQGLLELGMQEEYTMGYADELGFRASTASAFWWYDLEAEQSTKLRLVPFALMDVTLRQYLGLSPQEALARIAELVESVRKVGGTFSTLWHNNSLSEREGWEAWREVYEGMMELAQEGGGAEG